MTLYQELQNFGLHKSEIAVYLYLLEQGVSSPPQIAKGTKIARTNCYNILLQLKEKGLIELQQRGKRKAYLASDPEALVRNLEKKKQAVSRILPDLRGLYTLQKNKPKIQFYDGWDQVKEIYYQTLSCSTQEIFAIGSIKHFGEMEQGFFLNHVKTAKQKGIVMHDILSADSGQEVLNSTKEILKGFYDAKVLPNKYPNFKTDLLIWDNHIALITFEEPIFGTVLTNNFLADTFRVIFRALRDRLD